MKYIIKNGNRRLGQSYNFKIEDLTEPQAVAIFEALLRFSEQSPTAKENLIGYRVALSIHGNEVPYLCDATQKLMDIHKKDIPIVPKTPIGTEEKTTNRLKG